MIKVSLIVLCGLAATALLRRRSAAMRHFVLAAAIICAGASPLLEQVVPSWRLPLHPSLFGRSVEPLTLLIPVPVIHPGEELQAPALPASSGAWRFNASRILSSVWLA